MFRRGNRNLTPLTILVSFLFLRLFFPSHPPLAKSITTSRVSPLPLSTCQPPNFQPSSKNKPQDETVFTSKPAIRRLRRLFPAAAFRSGVPVHGGPPRAPDYAVEATWAAFPTSQLRVPPKAPMSPTDPAVEEGDMPPPPAGCDVFFIPCAVHTMEKREDHGVMAWDDGEVTKELGMVLSSQASVFAKNCRVYAPRYRHPTKWALSHSKTQEAQAAFELAYSDIVRAFRLYMKYENNGNPFMIASNHQGSAFALRLLQEFVDGTALLSRFVAGYLVEGKIATDTFTCSFVEEEEALLRTCNLRQIRLSEHRKDTGCIVGWQVAGSSKLPVCHWYPNKGWHTHPEGTEITCVNPLSWEEDDQRLVTSERARNTALTCASDKLLRQEALSFSAQVLGGVVALSSFGGSSDMYPSSSFEDDSTDEQDLIDFYNHPPVRTKLEKDHGRIVKWLGVDREELGELCRSPSAAYEIFYGSLGKNIDDRLRAWTLRTAPWFRPPTKQAISSIFGAPASTSIFERYAKAAHPTKRKDGPEHIIKYGPPGSGKTVRKGSAITTYMKSIGLDPAEVLDVAVDDIVISLGSYFREVMLAQKEKGLSAEERAIRQFQIYRKYRSQADLLADTITEVALKKNASIAMETTGRELYWVRNATAEATKRGYKTRVVYPYATMAQLVNRTMERAQSRLSSGFGRGIHPMAISDICMRSQMNFFDLITSDDVSEASLIDNTVGMFEEKKELFNFKNNGQTKINFPEISPELHKVTSRVQDSEKLESFSKHWYDQMRTLCVNFERKQALQGKNKILQRPMALTQGVGVRKNTKNSPTAVFNSPTVNFLDDHKPQPRKLFIFDFDGTLFRTPLPPPWWSFRWWDNPDSLNPPTVPDITDSSWWVEHTVDVAKEAIADRDAIAVLMTGRKELLFRTRIEQLLTQAELTGLDWVFLNDDGNHTSATKCAQMKQILENNPAVDEVHIYEDRYMETYTEYLARLSRSGQLGRALKVVAHDVKEQPNPPMCKPSDHLYAVSDKNTVEAV